MSWRKLGSIIVTHRDGVRIASPCAIRGEPELEEIPSGRQPEAGLVCHSCQAPVKGDGSYACQCGIIPVPGILPARFQGCIF